MKTPYQFKAGDLTNDNAWFLYRWDGVSVERFVVNDTWDFVCDADTLEDAKNLAENDAEEMAEEVAANMVDE